MSIGLAAYRRWFNNPPGVPRTESFVACCSTGGLHWAETPPGGGQAGPDRAPYYERERSDWA
eukprot:11138900-Alexandrium_andersonii.AAC.1